MKSTNTKTLAILLSLTIPAAALAQAKPATQNAIQPLVVQPVQTFTPGTDGKVAYSYSDVTKLVGDYTAEYFARQKDDRIFLENSVKDIVEQYNSMYKDLVMGKLLKASNESRLSYNSAIPVENFLSLNREYQAAREIYMNKLTGIQAIPNGGLPSAQILVTENKTAEVPAWRKVDVSGIVNNFKSKIQDLDNQVNAMSFKVVDRAGAQQDVTGFNIDYTKVTLILPEERRAQQAKINSLKMQMLPLFVIQDKFTALVVKEAKVYVTQFGENERYRWRSDQDLDAAKKTYERIAEAFWVRSWLRLKYGMGLGSFNLEYTKRWGGIEELMKKPEDFVNFGDISNRGEYMSIRADNQLLNVAENIRNNANVAEHRGNLGSTFSPFGVLTGVWTLASGRGPMMQTAALVLKMIENDVNEELLVTGGNGQAKMKASYKSHYYFNPSAKTKARELECAFDPDTIQAVVDGLDCGNSGVGSDAQSGGYVRTYFQQIDSESEGQQQNFELAARLQSQLNAQSGADKAMKKVRKGLQGL